MDLSIAAAHIELVTIAVSDPALHIGGIREVVPPQVQPDVVPAEWGTAAISLAE